MLLRYGVVLMCITFIFLPDSHSQEMSAEFPFVEYRFIHRDGSTGYWHSDGSILVAGNQIALLSRPSQTIISLFDFSKGSKIFSRSIREENTDMFSLGWLTIAGGVVAFFMIDEVGRKQQRLSKLREDCLKRKSYSDCLDEYPHYDGAALVAGAGLILAGAIIWSKKLEKDITITPYYEIENSIAGYPYVQVKLRYDDNRFRRQINRFLNQINIGPLYDKNGRIGLGLNVKF